MRANGVFHDTRLREMDAMKFDGHGYDSWIEYSVYDKQSINGR